MDEQSLSAFMDEIAEAHGRAAHRIGSIDTDIDLAGFRLRIRACGERLHARLTDMLIAVDPHDHRDPPACEILAFDSATSGVAMPSPPWPRQAYQLGNEIEGLRHGRFLGSYMLDVGALNLCDRERATGLYWAVSEPMLRMSQEAVPLRNLLHWLAFDRGVHLVHAAAVGRDGDGILVLGAKGAGKSTTSLAGMLAGLDFVADDFCLLARTPDGWRATALTNSARVTDRTLELLPALGDRITNLGAPDGHKAEITVADRLSDGLTIRALTTPVRSPVTKDPQRVDRATFVKSVMAGTVGVFPGLTKQRLQLLADLAHSLPCYLLPIGPELDDVDVVVAELVQTHGSVPA